MAVTSAPRAGESARKVARATTGVDQAQPGDVEQRVDSVDIRINFEPAQRFPCHESSKIGGRLSYQGHAFS